MVKKSSTGTRGVLPTLLASLIFLALIVPAAMGQANVKGQWTTLGLQTPINPVHAALMKNGKVLIVAGSGNCPPSQSGCPTGPPYGPGNASGAEVFDPVAVTITQLTTPYDMFCNGMIVLPDGRPFINSGSLQYDPFFGSLQSGVFDSSTNTFTTVQNMAHGRWYPTLTTLGDGRVMAFSGTDEHGNTNTTVEIYTVGTGWSQQYPSGWTPPLYPRMTLLPSGKVFYSGSGTSSALFDPSNTSWTLNVANTIFSGQRGYGTTVLLPLTPANGYDPRVMIMGGDSPATATTEIIDMGATSPKWTSGPPMSQARSQMNAVILPNGKVLAVGGSVNDEDLGSLSLNADLYDPATNKFSSAGANVYERLYHSVALLLPDGTVWLTGGNPSRGTYEPHMEIYQPAYLFNSSGGLATRPTITSAPGSVSWGNAFAVQTPDAANISSVVLMRPGAVTHSFNMDQRLVGMSFTAGSGTLTVTAPPNGNIAPPGYYMLFLVNSSGVPSVATFIQLVAGGSNPAPTVSGVSPTSGTTAGGTPVTINGTGFLAGASVTFGGTAATNVVVGSSTSITATTPAHAAGAVNVVVTNTDGQSGPLTNGYTYTGSSGGGTIAFVQVNSATPANNSSPVSVTYPLAQTAGNTNIVVVGWNDTTSTVSSVVDSRGNSYILAVGPTSGTALRQSIYYAKNIVGGSNTVTVTFSKAAFFVDVRVLEYSGLDATAPLDVAAGAAGTGLSANSGSATTTSANELIFGAGTTGGSFGVPPFGWVTRILTANSDNAIDQIVSSTGSYSAASTLTYSATWVMQMATFRASGQGGTTNPAPTVSGVSPTSGTTAGGTPVTINGTGFLAGASVTFGGTAATNVVLGGSTSITATTPAHAAGAVNVVVTNTDGQSGPLTNGYTYTASNPAPTVSGVSPTSGTTAGGTPVTINGTGFLAGASVTFGGTAATNVVFGSSTSITATTPAHAAGAVNVVVTNTDGQSGPLTNGYTYTGSSGGGTIAFVQVNSATPANNSSPVSVTYPLAQTAGNTNIVVVGWNDTTSTVSSVVDSQGNTYALAIGPTSGTALRQSIYYAKNIVGGSNTVTVTFNQAAFFVDVRVLEYSGLDPTAPLDVTAGAAGTGATANSGAATTTSANELIFGAGTTGGTFGTVGTGFVRRILTPDSDIAIDKTVSATGSNSASSALTYSINWVMQMATFKAKP
jgi:hypothetical protein